jgi:V8-like Glu-specific endopeptidase
VQQDEASLRAAIRESIDFLFNGSNARIERLAASIETEYIGPGQMVPAPTDTQGLRQGVAPGATPPASITAWIGVNPATCSQFRIRIPEETGRMIAARARRKGLGRADHGPGVASARPRDWLEPRQEQYVPPQTGPYFSGCQDTRLRTATLGYPLRTIADFSPDGQFSSCTGTLIGPRHILTAAHCLYQGNNTWHDFTVIPGRDATLWPFGSTQMSDTSR